MNLSDRIDSVRRALMVRRYHQYFTHETDTVGKHSAGVALYVDLVHPNASKAVIMAALSHDLGEVMLGDIPAPTKKQLPADARAVINAIEDKALHDMGYAYADGLTDYDFLLLKLADYFDGFSFCIEEVSRGNRTLLNVGSNYQSYLTLLINSVPDDIEWADRACDINTILNTKWSKVK